LALYVLLTHAAALLGKVGPEASVSSGLIYDTFFHWAEGHPAMSALLAALLVFFQAIMINALADTFRMMGDRTWLPGLCYVLAASFLKDFLFLSPPLVAVTFVPFALLRLFRIYKAPFATALIFDSAFWIAVGSLFYPPAILFIVAIYFGVLTLRTFQLKEQVVFMTGLLTPLFLSWLFYFWNDRGMEFRNTQTGEVLGWSHAGFDWDHSHVLRFVFLGILVLAVLLNTSVYYRKKLIQNQKYNTVIYWIFFIGFLTGFLQTHAGFSHFLLMAPSIGIFLAMWLGDIRKRYLAEIFHFLVLSFLLFLQYFNF
jgi:hypothetical protein